MSQTGRTWYIVMLTISGFRKGVDFQKKSSQKSKSGVILKPCINVMYGKIIRLFSSSCCNRGTALRQGSRASILSCHVRLESCVRAYVESIAELAMHNHNYTLRYGTVRRSSYFGKCKCTPLSYLPILCALLRPAPLSSSYLPFISSQLLSPGIGFPLDHDV